jgi:putative ABC transport system permease protein
MLGSYLLSLYRSMSRHQLYSALNIFGLAVGMAVFLVLWLATQFELSYDRWIPNSDRTWRVSGVISIAGRPTEIIGAIPGPVLPNMKAEYGARIEAGVRLLAGNLAVRRGEQSDYEDVVFADPTFFDVFDLPLAQGQKAQALADTSSLVVSEAMAKKYFGTTRAVGQRITLTTDGAQRDYRVSAVLKDLPDNTHLKIGFLARLDRSVTPDMAEFLEEWNATNYLTYVRLTDAGAADAINGSLKDFMHRRGTSVEDWVQLKLDPLSELHFNSHPIGSFKPGIDRRFVTMLQVIAVLTLLLAVINYVNLSTARAAMRAREVALRKVFGATRGALIAQFLTEAVVVSLVAGLIAVAIVELSLPVVNAALGGSLALRYAGEGGVLPLFALISIGVGLLSGVYPALVISRFQPAGVLAASRAPGGGRAAGLVREVLVTAQFAVSISLLICTAVVFSQSEFVRKADLGFKREGLILIHQIGNPQVNNLKNALQDAMRREPGVVSVTVSGRYPGRGGTARTAAFVRPGLRAERGASISMEPVGDQYMETYGIPMVAGRRFNMANRLDDMGTLQQGDLASQGMNIIINEAALKVLEFNSPNEALNQVIRSGSADGPALRIVGVARDARYGSAREKTPPLLYYRDTRPDAGLTGDETIAVRYRGDPQELRGRLEAVWKRIAPGVPFKAETGEASLGKLYEADDRRSLLLTLGAVVAGVIGCLGLYGLAAFASQRRTKEIGIRKVLGASTGDVLRLLIGQFLRPVVIANLIAWPTAFVLMREWLNGFDQRIDLTPVYFLAATGLALAVALVTVTGQALKVARADPGSALRTE